jgi:hypothetical protein
LPNLFAQDVVDGGVQARAGEGEAGLSEFHRHHQRALVVELGARQQQVDRALQPAEVHGAHAIGMGALHCRAGTQQEHHKEDSSPEQQAGADRTPDDHPRWKR